MPACRSVSFGIWVKTGSRHESAQQNGISHFIEHMLFKGTDRFTAKDIADVFDGIGGNVNAFTSKEYTCYYAKVLDEHVPIAVDTLANMIFCSRFSSEDIAKEKKVIIEEISMYEDTPDDRVHDMIARAAYGHHPLGYPILGTETNLHAMLTTDLQEYVQAHYGTESIVISVAGNIDDSMIELFEQHFGSVHNTFVTPPTESPTFLSGHEFLRKKTEQNHICISLPGCSLDDPLLYGMILLNNAVGGGMSSRLFQEIREKHGLAYSIYSYHTSFIDGGLFTLYLGTSPKQTTEVLRLTEEIIEQLRTNGITADELRRGKEQMKGSLIIGLESTNSRMTRNGKNELIQGRQFSLDELTHRIENVTNEEIQQLIHRVFSYPCATAMVGNSDKALLKWRDQYAAKIPS
jgi:predicted Zn-dependent peptidase